MKKRLLLIIGLPLICALIVIQLMYLFGGYSPYIFYPGILISLLVLLKIDMKVTGKIKMRHSMGYIFLCESSALLASLSGIDWMFSSLMKTEWHYALTVEGMILFIVILFSAMRSLTIFENKSTSEEKMMFG